MKLESSAEPRRFAAFLKQMIDRGIIPCGVEITGEHGGQVFTASIDAEGYVVLRGERFRKPGFAAKRITRVPVDGFEFWKYNGVPLARLRDKLWQAWESGISGG